MPGSDGGDDGDEIDEGLLALSLRTLVEELPFDVWVRDADDSMLYANAALRRRWGPGVVGKTVGTSEVESEVAETWRAINARVLAGETVRDEVVYELDGDEHTVIGVVAPIRDEGRVCGTVGINIDITGERRARADAQRFGQLASLGTLSASIGHEIGTSAAVSLGQVEIAMKRLERGAPAAEVLEGLREAQVALTRAIGVLRDMRALAVGATLGSERTGVDAAIGAVKEVLRRELAGHVTLHEARLAGAEVAMSQSRLVQVLLNLVRNALEAARPEGGRIWIEVTRPSPDRVRIDVADDGPGIHASLGGRLFQPFVSSKREGTGLGLYVCRQLVTASGGTIDALAREGGGVCMRLDLPSAG